MGGEALDAKQRITNAAARLFARRGYADTSVRQIAADADVNVSMISYYFGSKQGVLEALFAAHLLRIEHAALEAHGGDATPTERVRTFVRGLVQIFRADPDVTRVVFMELQRDVPEMNAFKVAQGRRLLAAAQALVETIQQARETPQRFEVIGPAIAGAVAWHFLLRELYERALNVSFDDAFYADYPDEIARLLLYGLIGRGPNAPQPDTIDEVAP